MNHCNDRESGLDIPRAVLLCLPPVSGDGSSRDTLQLPDYIRLSETRCLEILLQSSVYALSNAPLGLELTVDAGVGAAPVTP